MPFSLTNAPSTFNEVDDSGVSNICGKICGCGFDDTLVYNKSESEHYDHLKQEFGVLREQQLYENLKKCKFFIEIIIFLGYIVISREFKADLGKIEATQSQPTPKTINETRSFHGMVSFYRRFIKNFNSLLHFQGMLEGRLL